MPKPEQTTPWQYSDAKKLLTKDILDKKIDGLTSKEVFALRPEFQHYKYKNFYTNLRNLRSSLAELQGFADEDAAALAHDTKLNLLVNNNKPYPRWQGTDAERLLKQDLDNGRHENMAPRELKASRPEYKPYPGKVFLDHIHQELRSRKERPYWLARHKEKEEEKQKNKRRKK